MKPWSVGAHAVDDLITSGKISRLASADVGVPGLLDRADQQLVSARLLLATDPATAYVIAYDAAKHAAMALLAVQNLRPTADGGHLAMEKVLTAQFAGVFSSFNRLRRRRNELDYPSSEEDFADESEATKALTTATQIVVDAQTMIETGNLTTF